MTMAHLTPDVEAVFGPVGVLGSWCCLSSPVLSPHLPTTGRHSTCGYYLHKQLQNTPQTKWEQFGLMHNRVKGTTCAVLLPPAVLMVRDWWGYWKAWPVVSSASWPYRIPGPFPRPPPAGRRGGPPSPHRGRACKGQTWIHWIPGLQGVTSRQGSEKSVNIKVKTRWTVNV